jgi:hypothetical protein
MLDPKDRVVSVRIKSAPALCRLKGDSRPGARRCGSGVRTYQAHRPGDPAGEPAPARRCRPLQAAQRRRHIRASHRTVLGAIQQRYKAAREHGRVSEGGLAAVREAGFTEAVLVEIVTYISLSSPGRGRRLPPRTRCWRGPRGRGRCRGRVRGRGQAAFKQPAALKQAAAGPEPHEQAGCPQGRFGAGGQVVGDRRVDVGQLAGERPDGVRGPLAPQFLGRLRGQPVDEGRVGGAAGTGCRVVGAAVGPDDLKQPVPGGRGGGSATTMERLTSEESASSPASCDSTAPSGKPPSNGHSRSSIDRSASGSRSTLHPMAASSVACGVSEPAGISPSTASRSPRWAASSDAQLARLSGCAPVPVSSGRTDRHRLALGADAGCVVTTARPASFRLL